MGLPRNWGCENQKKNGRTHTMHGLEPNPWSWVISIQQVAFKHRTFGFHGQTQDLNSICGQKHERLPKFG